MLFCVCGPVSKLSSSNIIVSLSYLFISFNVLLPPAMCLAASWCSAPEPSASGRFWASENWSEMIVAILWKLSLYRWKLSSVALTGQWLGHESGWAAFAGKKCDEQCEWPMTSAGMIVDPFCWGSAPSGTSSILGGGVYECAKHWFAAGFGSIRDCSGDMKAGFEQPCHLPRVCAMTVS